MDYPHPECVACVAARRRPYLRTIRQLMPLLSPEQLASVREEQGVESIPRSESFFAGDGDYLHPDCAECASERRRPYITLIIQIARRVSPLDVESMRSAGCIFFLLLSLQQV